MKRKCSHGRGVFGSSIHKKKKHSKGKGSHMVGSGVGASLKRQFKKISPKKARGAAKVVLGSIEKQGGTSGKYAGIAKRLMSKNKKKRRQAVDDAVSVAFSSMGK